MKKQPLTISKETIKEKLGSDVRWIERAILMLFERQTSEEQSSGQTIVDNKMGFSGVDSRYLSWVAKWLKEDPNRHLNQKHFEKCSKKLPKYWKQISNLIEAQAERKKQLQPQN